MRRELDDLVYLEDFLSVEEDAAILENLSTLRIEHLRMYGIETKRKVASFGLDYKPGKKILVPAPPIPEYLLAIRDRAAKHACRDAASLQQALVTWYPAGSDIGWHMDNLSFGDTIVAVSLLGKGKLQLRQGADGPIILERALAPRSLYVLPPRYRYDHRHRAVAWDERWSVTFRSIAQATESP